MAKIAATINNGDKAVNIKILKLRSIPLIKYYRLSKQ